MIFSVWGPNVAEADTLVAGTNQPKFKSGELDETSPHFHYTIDAVSFEEAKKQFNKIQFGEDDE